MSHPAIFESPLPPGDAVDNVDQLLATAVPAGAGPGGGAGPLAGGAPGQARRNIAAFERSGAQFVAVNAAGTKRSGVASFTTLRAPSGIAR